MCLSLGDLGWRSSGVVGLEQVVHGVEIQPAR